jgi:hypothetical protein
MKRWPNHCVVCEGAFSDFAVDLWYFPCGHQIHGVCRVEQYCPVNGCASSTEPPKRIQYTKAYSNGAYRTHELHSASEALRYLLDLNGTHPSISPHKGFYLTHMEKYADDAGILDDTMTHLRRQSLNGLRLPIERDAFVQHYEARLKSIRVVTEFIENELHITRCPRCLECVGVVHDQCEEISISTVFPV